MLKEISSKGKARNRYAEIQPLVNRINGIRDINSGYNYLCAEKHDDESCIFDSNDYRLLKNDIGKSVLNKNSYFENIRKHKKCKHYKKKQRLHRAAIILELKNEVVDVLNCILYVMWSPIVFFTRLIITIAKSSVNILNLFITRGKSRIQKEIGLELSKNDPQILKPKSLDKNHSDLVTEIKNDVRIFKSEIEDENNQKELMKSSKYELNPSLEMVDEFQGTSKIKNDNFFHYSTPHQDISNNYDQTNKLSYSSKRFCNRKDSENRIVRHCENSIFIAGKKKLSFSKMKNLSLNGRIDSKRSRKNELESKLNKDTIESSDGKISENNLAKAEGVLRVRNSGEEVKKVVNGSGDRRGAMKIEESKPVTKFAKSKIDAKSKWLEMKKKFYGENYSVDEYSMKKNKGENISQTKSVSKLLPAHKIFQYNMIVGRARQIGVEPPSAEDIFSEKQTILIDDYNLHGSDQNGNEFSMSDNISSKNMCGLLSHTQSLSQWPLLGDTKNSSDSKKYSLVVKRPKAKPRTEKGLNSDCRIETDRVKTMSKNLSTGQFCKKQFNSSVSSANFRDHKVSRNLVDSQLQDRWRSTVKNNEIENENSLSDDYAAKIDSLISFCRYPSPDPPKDSN